MTAVAAAIDAAALDAADTTEQTAAVSSQEPEARAEDRVIPLCDLIASKRNVRKVGTSIEGLKASILAHGLFHNLTVTVAAKRGKFEVVAGGRRFQALTELRKEGKILKTFPVRCRVVPSAEAVEVSLAENIIREAMHPADAFTAFAKLVDDQGMTAQDIAARFSVSPSYVYQCLKLGRLSPKLLDLYRKGELQADQAKALTLSDSHTEQEAAWFDVPTHARYAVALRDRLTHEHIDAARDRRAQFIGLAAYEAAGGRVVRDLFAGPDDLGFWQDAPLVAQLTEQKLHEAAEAVRAEGWAWVEARTEAEYSYLSSFGRSYPTQREYTPEERAEVEALTTELDALAENETPEAGERAQVIDQRLLELQAGLEVWDPEVKASAGAIVYLDYAGDLTVRRGLKRTAQDDDAGEDGAVGRAGSRASNTGLSEALTAELSMHRTVALRAALIDRPDVALLALVHKLVLRVFYSETGSALEITLGHVQPPAKTAPDIEAGKAFQAVEERRGWWTLRIPANSDDLWNWLAQQDQETVMGLLAFCLAQSVNATQGKDRYNDDRSRLRGADLLAEALSLDMADWWEPTAAGYLGRVSKTLILDAVREGTGAAADGLDGMKKAALAAEAERRLAGSRWVPALLRKPGQRTQQSEQGMSDAQADDEGQDEALPDDEGSPLTAE
ncbi:ParB/RepB/Spo0J family partition protein [Azospirillum sp. A23]|uniref:ParB/RepB/Spo0J family partition protein n=1 Tax=Azospirillum sp. A23 TaxID=3160608 RepID=UPI0036F42FB7